MTTVVWAGAVVIKRVEVVVGVLDVVGVDEVVGVELEVGLDVLEFKVIDKVV